MKKFVYIWEYYVEEKYIFQFIEIYNPNGEWAQLFRKSKGYISTELYQDPDNPSRFITIDSWQSKKLRDIFREENKEEFDALDKRCEHFTEDERFIGDFNEF